MSELDVAKLLARIASATERIADALEAANGRGVSKLDGGAIAREVVSYTLQRAARGPGSLTTSSLKTKPSSKTEKES